MAGADTTEKNLAEHHDLHSERGALSGEHAGRATDPTVKVSGLAWLEFEKRDLDRSEQFARDFGLTVHARTDAALYLRGSRAGAPAVVIRQGRASRYLGAAFHALDGKDLDRLARATGAGVEARRELGSGRVVHLTDPTVSVEVVHGVEELPGPPRGPGCRSPGTSVAELPRGVDATSVRRASRPASSTSVTSSSAPASSAERWTGTCRTSG